MQSMTGYGSAIENTPHGRVAVTVRTVNHKSVELRLRIDDALKAGEIELTAQAKARLTRGRIEVHLTYEPDESAPGAGRFADVVRDIEAMRAQLARTPGIVDEASLGELLMAARTGGPPRAATPAPPAAQGAARTALGAAIDATIAFREAEGGRLEAALRGHIARCDALVADVAVRTKSAPAEKQAAWTARVEALGGGGIDPARLAQEIALLAERLDVSEELTRLNAHTAHFLDLCREDAPGRRLGFLCQELLREANTVGSKCSDAQTAHHVVDLKGEIEKLREQVANVA